MYDIVYVRPDRKYCYQTSLFLLTVYSHGKNNHNWFDVYLFLETMIEIINDDYL